MKHLTNYPISEKDIERLTKYTSRDGFVLVDESECNNVLETFKQYPIYKNLIPLLTDNNSNYWCLYIDGILKGMVCHLSHVEISLEPKFSTIDHLISTIENNPKAWDYYDLYDLEVFDFPIKENNTLAGTPIQEQLYDEFQKLDKNFIEKEKEYAQVDANLNLEDKDSINKRNTLVEELENLEQLRQQTAFCLMALTAKNNVESVLKPLLNHDDYYISERARKVIEFIANTLK